MPRGRISGPYIVGGGDGRDYFAVLPPEPLLIDGLALLEQARKEALRNPDPVEGRAQAAAISLVISQVGTDIEAAAIATAALAETSIIARLKATQRRPDPPGVKKRIQDAIRCRPLKTVVPGGGVGIGDIATLDAVKGRDGRPYWLAQEFGSKHLLGRTLYGYFQPGKAAPDPEERGVHPIFETQQGGKKMTIRRPIRERAYLREGAAIAEEVRQKELGAAAQGGVVECRAILSGVSESLERLRRIVR